MGAPATAPASFYNMRAKLVEAARRERFDGAAPRLTLAEQRCNATLMRMKQRLRKASPFLPALPFADARAQIGRTSLYRALSAMPKHQRHGPDPLGVLRSSEWWQRSYADLLPAAWASDATPAESADVDLDLHGGGGAGGGDVAMLDATVS